MEEGRDLLRRPVAGRLGEQIKIAMLQMLAESYVETKEWTSARQALGECLVQAEKQPDLIRHHGLEHLVTAARQRLKELSQKH